MDKAEFDTRLREVVYCSRVNQRYHQLLEWRWGAIDKLVRAAVGILAIAGVVLAVPKLDLAWPGFWVALASVVVAAVLNIFAIGDWEKSHGELFRLWNDLEADSLAQEQKTYDLDDPPDAHHLERLQEMRTKMIALNAAEPAPFKSLLKRCQEDENEAEWGPGVRTPEQVERRRKEMLRGQGHP
jgi:hypothetical protein